MEGRRLLAAEGVWQKEESSYLHHAAALEDRSNRHEEERKREQARWGDERAALLKRCARLEREVSVSRESLASAAEDHQLELEQRQQLLDSAQKESKSLRRVSDALRKTIDRYQEERVEAAGLGLAKDKEEGEGEGEKEEEMVGDDEWEVAEREEEGAVAVEEEEEVEKEEGAAVEPAKVVFTVAEFTPTSPSLQAAPSKATDTRTSTPRHCRNSSSGPRAARMILTSTISPSNRAPPPDCSRPRPIPGFGPPSAPIGRIDASKLATGLPSTSRSSSPRSTSNVPAT